MMTEEKIEEKLEQIKDPCERINEVLMNIYFSIKDEKEKKEYHYILNAAGLAYEAFCALKDKH